MDVITFKQGASFTRTFQWFDTDDLVLDLTGCSVRFAAKNDNAEFSASTDDGKIVINGNTAVLTILDTSMYSSGIYLADIKVTFQNNFVSISDTFVIKIQETYSNE